MYLHNPKAYEAGKLAGKPDPTDEDIETIMEYLRQTISFMNGLGDTLVANALTSELEKYEEIYEINQRKP